MVCVQKRDGEGMRESNGSEYEAGGERVLGAQALKFSVSLVEDWPPDWRICCEWSSANWWEVLMLLAGQSLLRAADEIRRVNQVRAGLPCILFRSPSVEGRRVLSFRD